MAIGYGIACAKPERARKTREDQRAKERAWQVLRKAVLARDGHRCRMCQRRDGIDVHHIRFRSAGGADVTGNCACLCRVCHEDIHAYRLALEGDANGTLKVTRL